MKYTRVHRLLKVLTCIQSGADWTPTRLARECAVAERTIYRDLKELEAVGIPIRFDARTRRYRVEGDFFLPPVQLAPDEALALVVLCEQVAATDQIAGLRPAWRAITKIQASLPASVRDHVAQLADSVIIRTAQAAPPGNDDSTFEKIQSAIANRRGLACVYRSLNTDTDDDEEFDFEPYALFFCVRAWYAVGYHSGRDEVRTLKLARFSRVVRTSRPYQIPENFSLEDHLGNAWRMLRDEKDVAVELRFDAEFARTIAETRWHKTQRIEFHDDGSAVFRCTVSGLDEIVWWVLSMGPHCRVVRPRQLADRVRELASRTAEMYKRK